jgi:hypothetical protein
MLAAFTAPERDEDNSSEASTRTPELHDQRLQGSAPPRDGAAPGPGMSRQGRENFSTGKDPGWDIDTRHQRIRAELVLTQSPDPAEFLELLQGEGERLGVVTHPVLIQRRAELIIILEPLIATLEGRADIRRQGVHVIERVALGGHDVQRVSAVPLHPHNLTSVLEPREYIGEIVGVELHVMLD